MADSCRPVSRHGRYNATGPSSVKYNADTAGYGNVDYTPSDEMYTVHQPSRPERPRTSRGRRTRADAPPRPESRRSGQPTRKDPDEETYGRPASRAGFSPESSYRYSHDEYSRQINAENERRLQNSPCDSAEDSAGDTYQIRRDSYGDSPQHRDSHRQTNTDRLIVSPSTPKEKVSSSVKQRRSPQFYGPSPTAPLNPSSHDYGGMSVSPIHRDEAQILDEDLHHGPVRPRHTSDNNQYPQYEGDTYQQHFDKPQYRDSPQMGTSPYQDSPQLRTSPAYHDSSGYRMDSPYHNVSPTQGYSQSRTTPETYRRPPPSQRPKSARPKTGRKKSARVRQRYEEQETSQPQQCDTASILNAGDPYGRPSSSLSRYKPLPAIGATTPRTPVTPEKYSHVTHVTEHDHSMGEKVERLTSEAEILSLKESEKFHPTYGHSGAFSTEDIQGANMADTESYSKGEVPSVGVLADFPQYLSEEIYKHSVSNFDRHLSVDEDESPNTVGMESNEHDEIQNSGSPICRPLAFLHELPDEPSEMDDRLLLAIKLPDGKRIQRYFRPSDSLESVLFYAENTNLTNYSDYNLVCNAPKTMFVDLKISLAEAQIKDRTVLYLEEKEE